MAVIVSFATVRGIGSIHAPGIGDVRSREDLTVPASTSNSAREGEVAIIANGEAAIVTIASGTTPDAAATTATAVTSAGFGVAAGATLIVPVKTGDKINVKAVS